MVSAISRRDLRLRPTAAEESDLVTDLIADLLDEELAMAPHVVAALVRRLGGDSVTIRETAHALAPAQRAGHRMLPTLLPLVPAMNAEFDRIEIDDRDMATLLIAACCGDDRVEILIDAAECGTDDIVSGALGERLTISSGCFAFVDARLPIWLRHTAPQAAVVRAHAALARSHTARGELPAAHWHRARGALERIPDVVRPLIATARELNESGHPGWAFAVAQEAADHAVDEELDEARLVAGAAAVAAGCMEDASELLGSLFPNGVRRHRSQALASLLIAQTCLNGVVPVIDPAEHRPRGDDRTEWHAWTRAAGLAAVLCAERGATAAMRSWLAEARAADARADARGEVRDAAVGLCWMLIGEDDDTSQHAPGAFSGALVAALRAAIDDDIELGLQILARTRAGLRHEVDPLIAGFEHSALVDAYLAVIEVLLHFWAGHVGVARQLLHAAAIDLPVAVPFAGLAVTLAHRLDIAVSASAGPLALALTQTLAAGARIDLLVENGIRSYLIGDLEQAAADLGLWHQRGAPGGPLNVPGLDEVGPIVPPPGIEPSELARARQLRARARVLVESSWRREVLSLAEEGAHLRSPFAHARLEAMLGATCARHGDLAAARRHLRMARSLFATAGADAWHALIEDRLDRLGDKITASASIATVPIAVIHDSDPLAASRVVWEGVLTEREIEVAMRIAQGAQNREIAAEFGSSVRTIEVHAGKIFTKLGVRSRVELTALAHRAGRHL